MPGLRRQKTHPLDLSGRVVTLGELARVLIELGDGAGRPFRVEAGVAKQILVPVKGDDDRRRGYRPEVAAVVAHIPEDRQVPLGDEVRPFCEIIERKERVLVGKVDERFVHETGEVRRISSGRCQQGLLADDRYRNHVDEDSVLRAVVVVDDPLHRVLLEPGPLLPVDDPSSGVGSPSGRLGVRGLGQVRDRQQENGEHAERPAHRGWPYLPRPRVPTIFQWRALAFPHRRWGFGEARSGSIGGARHPRGCLGVRARVVGDYLGHRPVERWSWPLAHQRRLNLPR